MKESIGDLPLFAGLDRRLLLKLEENTIECRHRRGEVIIQERETGLGMYIIHTGRVEVTEKRQGSAIRLAELGPQQFFAPMSLIEDTPSSTTITAVEETECLLIPRGSFKQLMDRNPRLAIQLARLLVERIGRADEFGQGVPYPPPAAAEGVSATSVKAAIEERMVSTFERLYVVKAFTRFSVAVLGCPVEGTASNLIDEIRLGDVKALIVPAGEPVEVRIEAWGWGSFNLHVFTSELATGFRFVPVPIQPGDVFTLRLPAIELVPDGARFR